MSGKNPSKPNDISVMARVRPGRSKTCLSPSFSSSSLSISLDPHTRHEFSFDWIFHPESSQDEVFQEVGIPALKSSLAGYNSTVLVYGQTGAGKTHTMMGVNGLIPEFAMKLFGEITKESQEVEFQVRVQIVEIYLEKVFDLLGQSESLQIREGAGGEVGVPDAQMRYCCEAQELLLACEEAKENRQTHKTLMNETSSRSHLVVMLQIMQRDSRDLSERTSKVNLVDLAGSEMIKRTGAEGDRLSEAQAINSSLSALGLVIKALTERGTTHVPYRDSKLTRLLQESLGGNAKTWLIVNVSPDEDDYAETLSTLRFGQRAKAIKNRAVVNVHRSVKELEEALSRAEATIALQAETIRKLEHSNGTIETHKNDEETELGIRSNSCEELEKARGNANDALDDVKHQETAIDIRSKLRIEELEQERDDALLGWERGREYAAVMEKEFESKEAAWRRELEGLISSAAVQSTAETIEAARLKQLVDVHRLLLKRYADMEITLAETRSQLISAREDLTKIKMSALRQPGMVRSSSGPMQPISQHEINRVVKMIRGGAGGV